MTQSKKEVVGFILKGYPRLSETFIINEILLLERLGFRLHIFALRNPGDSGINQSARRVTAKVTYIPDHFWRFLIPFLLANFRLWWQRPGIYWHAFRFAMLHSFRQRNSATVKRFAQASYLVKNCLPENAIAHFHAHFANDPTSLAFFASRLSGIHYSFSAHAKDIYLQEACFLKEKIARALFVVTCTDYNRRFLISLCGESSQVVLSYHGIDLESFKPAPRLRNGDAKPIILSVGRFVPKKGFPWLLRALHQLKQEKISFLCHIIGDGPMKEELESLVARLELGDCVNILSSLSPTDLVSYYQEANIFALACEIREDGDRDGIPNVLVEAMATETAVVSTMVSGIPELIEDGLNGLLVPEKNPSALAEALKSMILQPEVARKLGQAGREKVARDFDSSLNVNKIGFLLESVLDNETTHGRLNRPAHRRLPKQIIGQEKAT